MDSMEFNKIFAGILIAGIIASLSGFISQKLIHPHELEEHAYKIEGVGETVVVADKPKLPEPVLAMIATADIERGKKLSKACAACHNFEPGGPNGVGPNLYDVVGGPKGHADGFSYSDAILQMGGSWTYDHLNNFLWKPKAFIAGTKMNYIGLKKPEDRAAMIAWLRSLSDNPAPLPKAEAIQQEEAAFYGPEEAQEGEAPAEQAPESHGDAH